MRSSFFIYAILSVLIHSCDVIGPCDQMTTKEAVFLLDVTDSVLFESIEKDIKTNFSSFMKKNDLASIGECERFVFSVGHLSGRENLEMESAKIELTTKGESLKKQQSLKNPSGIGVLMKSKLEDYKSLTAQEEYTSGSFLANQILRAANETAQNGSSSVFVFSDLIENNKYLNMYKEQIDFSENPEIIHSIIEPSVLHQFQSNQKAGKSVNIIFVQKDEPNGKVDRREIKVFWEELFSSLKIDHQFVDNLSQNVNV